MAHKITHVEHDSIANELGIKAGDVLLKINNEPIIDQIDYQALVVGESLDILIMRSGKEMLFEIEKDEYDPLGIKLEDTLVSNPRPCKNKCVFCFIDQMPPALRSTLYVKDDDWRLSLMMGNYVTLTNVTDEEMSRIIKRHASPLYISVHATDGDVRKRMMKNPEASDIMRKLNLLKDNDIQFHCQIVLCPGYNDGAVLEKTLQDLVSLYPAAQSAALVPVGLTKYREHLEKLIPYDGLSACALLDKIIPMQKQLLDKIGTRFVFPSDEFYCLSGYPLPKEHEYEDFPQIENGVGLLSLFEADVKYAYDDNPTPTVKPSRRVIACGTSVAAHMKKLCDAYAPKNVNITVIPIQNNFFGTTVTVTGLITGGDLVEQLKHVQADEILICANMLRAERDLFLDDMTIEQVRKALPAKLVIVENEGDQFYRAICGLEES